MQTSTPLMSLPPRGPRKARLADRRRHSLATSSLPSCPPSLTSSSSESTPARRLFNDPAVLQVTQTSTSTSTSPEFDDSSITSPTGASFVGPPSLIAELAKFDEFTPYEELRYVMELTAVQAIEGVYPIPPSPTLPESCIPPVKLCLAAKRYLAEYNAGGHRLPPPPPPPPAVVVTEPYPVEQAHYDPGLSPTNGYFAPLPLVPQDPHFFPMPHYAYYPVALDPSFAPYDASFVYPYPPSPVDPTFFPPPLPHTAYSPLPPPAPTFEISQPDISPSSTSVSQFSTPDLSLTPLSSTFSLSPATTPATSPALPSFPFDTCSTRAGPSGGGGRTKSLARLAAEEFAQKEGSVKSWGVVKFFDGNKGWGFILDQSRIPGEDIWVHYTNLEIAKGHRFLVAEELVEYLIVWDSKKIQLKSLLVTGLGGTQLMASSSPELALSLSKFKPSQGPLPSDLSPNSKRKVYESKAEKKRLEEEKRRQEEEEERVKVGMGVGVGLGVGLGLMGILEEDEGEE